MRYGIFLLSAAGLLATLVWTGPLWRLLLLWPIGVLLWVAAGYFGLGGRILFKRPDGRIPWPVVVLLGPYLWTTWLLWHAVRLLGREDPYNRITDRIWLGRRLLAHELKAEVAVDLIVDLTAEFSAPRGLLVGRGYRCLPTLDGAAPAREPLGILCDEILSRSGGVFVHCAAGHARSAALVALMLIRGGQARDAADAMRLIAARRPWVRLNRAQYELVEGLTRPDTKSR